VPKHEAILRSCIAALSLLPLAACQSKHASVRPLDSANPVLVSRPAPTRTGDPGIWALIDGTSSKVRPGVDELRAEGHSIAGDTALYGQYYHGIRVLKGWAAVKTSTATNTLDARGDFIEGIAVDARPKVSEADAVERARKSLSGTRAALTGDPAVRLVVYPGWARLEGLRLCLEVKIGGATAYVDAHDGSIVSKDDGVRY
jgi:hypothetical protein